MDVFRYTFTYERDRRYDICETFILNVPESDLVLEIGRFNKEIFNEHIEEIFQSGKMFTSLFDDEKNTVAQNFLAVISGRVFSGSSREDPFRKKGLQIFNFQSIHYSGIDDLKKIQPLNPHRNGISNILTRILKHISKANNAYKMKVSKSGEEYVSDILGITEDEFCLFLKDLKMVSNIKVQTNFGRIDSSEFLRRPIDINGDVYMVDFGGNACYKKTGFKTKEMHDSLERIRCIAGIKSDAECIKSGLGLIIREVKENDGTEDNYKA